MTDAAPVNDLLAPVPWETRNLGRPSFALRTDALRDTDIASVHAALNRAAADGPIFVQAKLTLDELRHAPRLASLGFYCVETAICPHANLRRCSALDAFERDPATALHGRTDPAQLAFGVAASDDDRAAIRAMAATSFEHDRFHLDPHCDKAIADRRFALWVDEMFEQGKRFYLLRVGGVPAGFMVRSGDTLPLAGFAPAYTRSGLGDFLWLSTMLDMRREGQPRVQTTISANNVGVLNLYARLGYRFRDPVHVYHHWSDARTA